MAEIDIQTATIAAGQSLSGEIDIGGKILHAIILPSGWSAAAGGLSFQASPDGGTTWAEVRTTAGVPFSIPYTSPGAVEVAIDPTTLRGLSSLKIRSGTQAAPVNQTNFVTLQLATRLVL